MAFPGRFPSAVRTIRQSMIFATTPPATLRASFSTNTHSYAPLVMACVSVVELRFERHSRSHDRAVHRFRTRRPVHRPGPGRAAPGRTRSAGDLAVCRSAARPGQTGGLSAGRLCHMVSARDRVAVRRRSRGRQRPPGADRRSRRPVLCRPG